MSSTGSKMLLNRNAGTGPGAGLGAAEELGVERSFGFFEGVLLVEIVRFGGMMTGVVSRDVHSMKTNEGLSLGAPAAWIYMRGANLKYSMSRDSLSAF